MDSFGRKTPEDSGGTHGGRRIGAAGYRGRPGGTLAGRPRRRPGRPGGVRAHLGRPLEPDLPAHRRPGLRLPPTGGVLSTAHDVSREWRFISALAPTAVPVAAPVAYCADATVTGAEFYVMEFVEGLVLADQEAGLALAPQARARAAEHLIDVLVALHALDPVAVGLGDMVRKTGYVERHLRRWHAQVHATGAPELALLDEVHDLLARRIPAQSNGIVHGDYRAGNLAFGSDGAVRAVFHWELATTGDPLADLGYLASSWPDPGEPLLPTTPGPST